MSLSLIIALLMIIALMGVLTWYDRKNNDGIHPMLLQAVKGNKALAKRLLEQAKFKYPGKSDRWYVEKIIYDLERDGAGGRGRATTYRMSGREVREKIFLFSAILGAMNMILYTVTGWFRGRG
ncbi:hypothetical protein ACE1CD_15330 [Aerosakkonema sp. BLCC-F183]|uniref:hypothetical protein n=1 Tax=Aerosakkonema sp. BLCC-F183 TaxID=3342834 RepID=UPI0035B6C1A4